MLLAGEARFRLKVAVFVPVERGVKLTVIAQLAPVFKLLRVPTGQLLV